MQNMANTNSFQGPISYRDFREMGSPERTKEIEAKPAFCSQNQMIFDVPVAAVVVVA